MQEGNSTNVEVLKSTMAKWSKDDIEKERKSVGFAFGPQFSLIVEAWSNDIESLALIQPTEEIIKESSVYVIHPSVIDSCFQSMLFLKSLEGKFVPKKITHVTIVRKPTSMKELYVHTKLVESEKTPTYNITLMDRYARPVMVIQKFITAEISADKTKVTFENTSFTFGWEQMASETMETSEDIFWLILRDQSQFAERLSGYIPQGDRVHFVDVQDTTDVSNDLFSEVLEEILSKLKVDEKLLVLNFWPVDSSKFDADTNNFDATHSLGFESCLFISQELIKRQAIGKNIQLVFVTSGAISIPQQDQSPTIDVSDTFPWSASVFGFRRTFSEEISVPYASVVDLPNNPTDDDLYAMAEDLRKATIEEEVVYREGARYVNRFKKLDLGGRIHTKPTPPATEDGEQKPFKMSHMSGQWFLQKTSREQKQGKLKICIDFASPILQKPWVGLKWNDRITFAGKLCDSDKERKGCFVVGICKVQDLGSYVDVEKCCFSEIKDSFTPQQAASLGFPLAMSYHVLMNLLGNTQKKKVLIYHHNEDICRVFACVAMSLDINVVCLVKDQSVKMRMENIRNLMAITEDEVVKMELNGVDLDLDAICLLSKNSTYVVRQIMKYLKPGASVVTVYGEENVQFNPFIYGKDVQCIMTNLENITESSKKFSDLLVSCCSNLKSKGFLKNILDIPQLVFSIYDIMNDKSEKRNSDWEKEKEIRLYTVSLKPKNIPGEVFFYSLPLDENGLKNDSTYLVVGGVRGFGFQVAKWMVENGAKTVMCTARSMPSEEKMVDVQRLEQETGSRILLRQADVTSWKDMNTIKEELDRLPPVAGIVFTAMVLQDQLLKDADLKTCKKIVETKVKGKSFIMIVIINKLANANGKS